MQGSVTLFKVCAECSLRDRDQLLPAKQRHDLALRLKYRTSLRGAGIRNHHGLPRRQSLEYKLGEMEQRSANSCNDGVEVERGSGG